MPNTHASGSPTGEPVGCLQLLAPLPDGRVQPVRPRPAVVREERQVPPWLGGTRTRIGHRPSLGRVTAAGLLLPPWSLAAVGGRVRVVGVPCGLRGGGVRCPGGGWWWWCRDHVGGCEEEELLAGAVPLPGLHLQVWLVLRGAGASVLGLRRESGVRGGGG